MEISKNRTGIEVKNRLFQLISKTYRSHGDQSQPGPSRPSTSDSTVGKSGDSPNKHDHHFFGPSGGHPTQVSTFSSTGFNIGAPEFVSVSHCPDITFQRLTRRDPLEETSTFSTDQTNKITPISLFGDKEKKTVEMNKNEEHDESLKSDMNTAEQQNVESTTPNSEIFKPFELSAKKLDIPSILKRRMHDKKDDIAYRTSVAAQLIKDYKRIDNMVQMVFNLKTEAENFSVNSDDKTKLMTTIDSTLCEVKKLPAWDHEPVQNKLDGLVQLLSVIKQTLKNKKISECDWDIPESLKAEISENKKNEKRIINGYKSNCTKLENLLLLEKEVSDKAINFSGNLSDLMALSKRVKELAKEIYEAQDYKHEPIQIKKNTALKSLSDTKIFLSKIKSDIQLDMPEDLWNFIIHRCRNNIKVSVILKLKENYNQVTVAETSAFQLKLETSQISEPLSELEVIQEKVESLIKSLKEIKGYQIYFDPVETKLKNTLHSLVETNELLIMKKLELQVDVPKNLKKEMKNWSTRGIINEIKNLQKACEELDKAVEMTISYAHEANNFSGDLYRFNILMQNVNRIETFLRHFNTYNHPPLQCKVETAITSLLQTKEVLKEKEVEIKLDIPDVLKIKIDQDPSKKEMLIKQLQENRSNLAKFEKEVEELVATADAFWGNMSELKVLMEKMKSSLESVKNLETYDVATEKSRQQAVLKSLLDGLKLLEDREPMIEAQENIQHSSMEVEQATSEPPPDLTSTLMNSSESSMQLLIAYQTKLLQMNRKLISTCELAKTTQIIIGVELKAYYEALSSLTPNSESEKIMISNLKDLCVDLNNRLKSAPTK